jgi:hypothetical protein
MDLDDYKKELADRLTSSDVRYDPVCRDLVYRFLKHHSVEGAVSFLGRRDFYLAYPAVRAADVARFLGISKTAVRRKFRPFGITERAWLPDGSRGYLAIDLEYPLVKMLAAHPENRPGHIVH